MDLAGIFFSQLPLCTMGTGLILIDLSTRLDYQNGQLLHSIVNTIIQFQDISKYPLHAQLGF